ncbi:MAG: hypothetical protein ABI873_20065 [Marmoricola sp.]
MQPEESPRELARAESERGEVVLRERPGDVRVLELRVNGVFVMDTLETSTERALAGHALELVATPRRVLLGGLGLGFTAHEVLADPRVERVLAVEIEPALIGWMRDGTVPHGPLFLADERLAVTQADVAMAVAEAAPASYDLVLLDIDNGPGYLVHDANAAVYREPFLTACREALAPGGAVVIWSADAAPELESVMRSVFGEARSLAHDVDLQGRTEQYWLLVGRVR